MGGIRLVLKMEFKYVVVERYVYFIPKNPNPISKICNQLINFVRCVRGEPFVWFVRTFRTFCNKNCMFPWNICLFVNITWWGFLITWWGFNFALNVRNVQHVRTKFKSNVHDLGMTCTFFSCKSLSSRTFCTICICLYELYVFQNVKLPLGVIGVKAR